MLKCHLTGSSMDALPLLQHHSGIKPPEHTLCRGKQICSKWCFCFRSGLKHDGWKPKQVMLSSEDLKLTLLLPRVFTCGRTVYLLRIMFLFKRRFHLFGL